MSSSDLRIPSLTGLCSTGLPSKRAISTCLSAATITPLARRISSGVKTFLAPSEPFVSTRILTPISRAFFLSASSAIKVCAIPVGQAVTATTNAWESGLPTISFSGSDFLTASAASLSFSLASPSACFASNKADTSSGVRVFISCSMNSLSINSLDSEANVRRCMLPAPSGAAIIKKIRAGSSSSDSNSTPVALLANTTVASFTALVLACGIAIPPPIPVLDCSSRLRIISLNRTGSLIRPLAARPAINSSIAPSLVVAFKSIIIVSFIIKSVIFMSSNSLEYFECCLLTLLRCRSAV
ncbi:hypothetical protein D3C71_1317060 [compost metagenome]